MHSPPSSLAPMLKKLRMWHDLDEDDAEAVLGLPCIVRHLRAEEFLARVDDRARHAGVLIEGFAYRSKIAGNGQRQIFSIHMSGDLTA